MGSSQSHQNKRRELDQRKERDLEHVYRNNVKITEHRPTNLYPNLNSNFNVIPQQAPRIVISPTGTCYPYNATTSNNIHSSHSGVSMYHNTPIPTTDRIIERPSAPPLELVEKPHYTQKRNVINFTTNQMNLNCDSCKKKLGLVIYNCAMGHSSCDKCKVAQVPCGICLKPITDQRNHELENCIGQVSSLCPNKGRGCELKLKLKDMEIHSKVCPFNNLPCPLHDKRCLWKGNPTQLKSHLNDHSELIMSNVNQEMVIYNKEFLSSIQKMYLIQLGNYLFLVHIKACDEHFLMTTQLIGPKTKAEKWCYTLNLYNKLQPRRKFEYTDTCYSSYTPVKKIFQELKCAHLPINYVKTYFNKENSLNFKFYIRQLSDK